MNTSGHFYYLQLEGNSSQGRAGAVPTQGTATSGTFALALSPWLLRESGAAVPRR